MSTLTHSNDPRETEAFGRELATGLTAGAVIALYGNLGAGKTVVARGIIRGLGIDEPVTSPTFTVVQEYPGPELAVYHIDLYRLATEEDALAFGIEDFLSDPRAITIVEWPERIPQLLPSGTKHVEITSPTADSRTLQICESAPCLTYL